MEIQIKGGRHSKLEKKDGKIIQKISWSRIAEELKF